MLVRVVFGLVLNVPLNKFFSHVGTDLDWLQSLKHFFHKAFSASLFQVLVANLLLMAQFYIRLEEDSIC